MNDASSPSNSAARSHRAAPEDEHEHNVHKNVPHGHHAHAHGHDHAHELFAGRAHNVGRVFAIATMVNAAFVVVEFVCGVLASSTALMADAGHNLSDVLGLVLAWGALTLTRRPADTRYTFGLRSSSVLAALGNATVLLLACGAIAWEAAGRFYHPAPVQGSTVMWIAGIGIAVNGVSALLFARRRHDDLNIRGAYLHMLGDAGISLGVMLTGAVIGVSGWVWLDPVVSLAIVAFIVWATWDLMREALRLALHAVPKKVDLHAVRDYLRSLPGVTEVQDLHIWGMSTSETALTARLVIPMSYPGDTVMEDTARELSERFGIGHSTLQYAQSPRQLACVLWED